ncbi:hypothetical protein LI177_03145 [bacterium 210820-DFI.6.37]|nr:hypothetical protein [bacterium 210820-DFI.6.37]
MKIKTLENQHFQKAEQKKYNVYKEKAEQDNDRKKAKKTNLRYKYESKKEKQKRMTEKTGNFQQIYGVIRKRIGDTILYRRWLIHIYEAFAQW